MSNTPSEPPPRPGAAPPRGHSAAGLFDALAWFTRLPTPQQTGEPSPLALGWLPAVGIVVALLGGLARLLTIGWMGSLASAVVAVAVCVAATGAYHEDGLADSFDGLWGGWDPERRLEIMRDSRLGTYGAAALVLSLLLRVAILAPLDAGATLRTLVAGHVLGRATVLPLLAVARPVREDGALSSIGSPSRAAWAIGAITTIVAVGGAAGPTAGAAAAVVAAGIAALFARIAITRIGGLTGDVLGAANQLAHIAAMAVVAALIGGAT